MIDYSISTLKSSIPEVYEYINNNISSISRGTSSADDLLKKNKNWYTLLSDFFNKKASEETTYSDLIQKIIDTVNYNDYTDNSGVKHDYSDKRNILLDAFADSKKNNVLSDNADSWISSKLPEVYKYVKSNISKINLTEDKINELWKSTDWYDKLCTIFGVSSTVKDSSYSKLVTAMVTTMTSGTNPKYDYNTTEMKDSLQSTFSDSKKDKPLSNLADNWILKNYPDIYNYISKNLGNIDNEENITKITQIWESADWYSYLEMVFGIRTSMSDYKNMNISKLAIAMITVMLDNGYEQYKEESVQENLCSTFADSKKNNVLSDNAESWIKSNFSEIYDYIKNNLTKIDDYRSENKDASDLAPSSTISSDLQTYLFGTKDWYTYLSIIFDIDNNCIYSNLYYFPSSVEDLVNIIAEVHELTSVERAGLLEFLNLADTNNGLEKTDISNFENNYDNMFYLINEHCKREIDEDLSTIMSSKNWYALLCMAYGLADVDKSLLEQIEEDDDDDYDDDDYGGSRTQLTNQSIWTHEQIQQTQPVTIGGIEFDALISANWNLSATLPNYTVEDGYEITDNIVLQQETMDLTLFLTDTPLTWVEREGHEMGHTLDTIAALRELYYKRQLFEVVTREAEYSDMYVKSIKFSKSKDVGYSREVSVSLQQVRITQAETVEIPESYGKAMPEGGVGIYGTEMGFTDKDITENDTIVNVSLSEFSQKQTSSKCIIIYQELAETTTTESQINANEEIWNRNSGSSNSKTVGGYTGSIYFGYTNNSGKYYIRYTNKYEGMTSEEIARHGGEVEYMSLLDYISDYEHKDIAAFVAKAINDSDYYSKGGELTTAKLGKYYRLALNYNFHNSDSEKLKYYGSKFCGIIINLSSLGNENSEDENSEDENSDSDDNNDDSDDSEESDAGTYAGIYDFSSGSFYVLLSGGDGSDSKDFVVSSESAWRGTSDEIKNATGCYKLESSKGNSNGVVLRSLSVAIKLGEIYNSEIYSSGSSGGGDSSSNNTSYNKDDHNYGNTDTQDRENIRG